MSSTSFILAPSTSTIPLEPSPTLHLLPFSLGSSSIPYSSKQSSTSSYFIPRPAPPNTPGLSTGQLTASFRGRALVGQSVGVPKGYRGVVLSTSARPDKGGVEERKASTRDSATASSSSSGNNGVSKATESGNAGANGEGASGRVTRARGTGQVALARPKSRRPVKKGNKRIKLDSDDEDEAEEGSEIKGESGIKEERGEVTTPRKRSSRRHNGDHDGGDVIDGEDVMADADGVPSITVQGPTPKKRLGPTLTEISLTETEVDSIDTGSQSHSQSQLQLELSSSTNSLDEKFQAQGLGGGVSNENIVPSPATEDDPPNFLLSKIPTSNSAGNAAEGESVQSLVKKEDENMGDGRIVRVLRTKATFSEITLWTPDAPLAGFRAEELEEKAKIIIAQPQAAQNGDLEELTSAERNEVKNEKDEKGMKGEKGTDEGVLKLHEGWWRVGGAGEGGDEFVRAMGEWIGLVEMINEPVYLQGEEEGEGEDEEDDD